MQPPSSHMNYYYPNQRFFLLITHILGEKNKVAEYNESGCRFRFNVESCYFSPILDIDLKNFEHLKCLQRGYKMGELYLPEDFIYVKEIISRPFPEKIKKTFLEALTTNKKSSGKGGTKKKTKRNRRKSIRHRPK